ncbi:MAG TPA: hypothetical protein VNN10_07290 [Dehalococcoidia bacterium]|nr:hypothetical protein [Dehalococcoidia bacterium]
MREHTEFIHPPRALWVSFPFGRPFGPPNQRDFQLGVLRALLRLFECASGPVLEDYPFDSPTDATAQEDGWSCVLPLPPLQAHADAAASLKQALEAEVRLLMPWYEESVRRLRRTTFGASGLAASRIGEAASYLAAVAAGETPGAPIGGDVPLRAALRLLVEDMKAYYLEAAAAQPSGAALPGAMRLNRWLYHETVFGDVLYRIRDRLAAEAEALPAAERPPPLPLIHAVFRERPARR